MPIVRELPIENSSQRRSSSIKVKMIMDKPDNNPTSPVDAINPDSVDVNDQSPGHDDEPFLWKS
jgi:hypothetical protein